MYARAGALWIGTKKSEHYKNEGIMHIFILKKRFPGFRTTTNRFLIDVYNNIIIETDIMRVKNNRGFDLFSKESDILCYYTHWIFKT